MPQNRPKQTASERLELPSICVLLVCLSASRHGKVPCFEQKMNKTLQSQLSSEDFQAYGFWLGDDFFVNRRPA